MLNDFEKNLLSSNVLTQDQLTTYKERAELTNTDFIEYLYDQPNIDQSKLIKVISEEYGFNTYKWDAFSRTNIPLESVDGNLVIDLGILPVNLKPNNTMQVLISHPKQINSVEALRQRNNFKIEILFAERNLIEQVISENFSIEEIKEIDFNELFEQTDDEIEDEDATTVDDENNRLVQFMNQILREGISQKASDLHFEPLEAIYRIRFRVDGILRTVRELPKNSIKSLTNRLKVLASMDISERRRPQDGRFRFRYNDNRVIDFRVSSLPTTHGEKMVLRVLDETSAHLGIEALGFSPMQKSLYLEALHRPQGMVLITGPTGSGKTVSLYTGIGILNTPDRNISTAEDPVEINLPGISQVSMNAKTGVTFANTLKAFLRQDPDVIMVGEIRDYETAEISIQAAQTGHLVLSTLHTNSAAETLTRLRNMGIPAFNIATTIKLVIAQRLVRKLCSRCKTQLEITPAIRLSLIEIGFTEVELSDPNLAIYEAVGCRACNKGYNGRVGVYEVVKITPKISELILQNAHAMDIENESRKEGFVSLRQSGISKVIAGLTSVEEVMRVTSE